MTPAALLSARQRLAQAWQARAPRERVALAAAAVVVPLLLLEQAFWHPARQQAKALATQETQARQQLAQLEQAASPAQPANAAERAAARELDDLQQELQALRTEIATAHRQMLSPEEMVSTLRGLTTNVSALRVTSLRSLPLQPVAQAAGQPALYRHRFELTLRGSWAGIAAQLSELQDRWPALRWSTLDIQGREHPAITARIELYTLSEDPTWIRL